MEEREFDVVVLGATGVTGRRVAAYLAERAPGRWAPAGRDAQRVRERLGEVGVDDPPPPLTADTDDPGSLRDLAQRARVVLNLVGPYTLYAQPVIAACVDAGAHYLDLTGEMGFVRATIEREHERARAAGVKVVQPCGFEALPPDLATLRASELAHSRFGEPLREVDVQVHVHPPPGTGPGDMLSGGTIQSLRPSLEDDRAAELVDPALLVRDRERAERVRRVSPVRLAPRVGEERAAIAPMMPSPFINPPVIQRTFALLADDGDGPADEFAYREGMAIDGSPLTLVPRLAAASVLAAAGAGTGLLMRAPAAVRRAAAAAVARAPGSGYGPSRRLEDWHWRLALRARTSGGGQLAVDVDGDGHPGYLSTARMLGEAGLLLAEDGVTPGRAGCLTPAAALGTGGLERFATAGLRFTPT